MQYSIEPLTRTVLDTVFPCRTLGQDTMKYTNHTHELQTDKIAVCMCNNIHIHVDHCIYSVYHDDTVSSMIQHAVQQAAR